MAEQSRPRGEAAARQLKIQNILSESGPVSIKELARLLHFSKVTIYRDVKKLEQDGIVQLSKGLVIPERSFVSEAPPALRFEVQSVAKMRICETAVDLISPDSTIILDDSSTVLPLIELLERKAPISVITNSLYATERLRHKSGVRLYVAGGLFYPWADAFHGHMAIRALQGVQADICFISTTAVSSRGAADSFDATAEIKAAMVAVSETRVLLADHTKFGRTALHTAARLEDLDVIITDKAPTRPSVEELTAKNIQVLIAD